METSVFEDQTYEGRDFTAEPLPAGSYDYCCFKGCNLSGADLSEIKFLETEFTDCDLSNANLQEASFQDVLFKKCKMLGLRFEECRTFAFSAVFDECRLDHTSFFEMNLSNCRFSGCRMEGVDLAESNLESIEVINCDLKDAIFERTNLQGADLRGSVNFRIDPEVNPIRGAKFSLSGLSGLLDKYDIQVDPGG